MTSLNLFITQSPAHKTVGHVVSGQKYLLKKIIFTCPLLYCRMTSNFSEPFQDASKIYLFTNISELKVRKHTQRGKKKKTLIHILLTKPRTLSNCPTAHHSSLIIFHLLLHYSYTTHYTDTKLLISPQTSFSSHSYLLHPGCIFPLPHPVIPLESVILQEAQF